MSFLRKTANREIVIPGRRRRSPESSSCVAEAKIKNWITSPAAVESPAGAGMTNQS